MADVLQVEKRDKVGTAATQRIRREGMVPAVLYGHGEANKHLAVPKKQVNTLIRHHSKMVKLEGEVTDTALVNEIHWDPLGIEVLHLDLIRVNLKEEVDVTVAIHTRGEAEGVRSGGVLLENMHEVDIRCPAGGIPEFIEVDVSDLAIGSHLTAGDLVLPSGVVLVTPPESIMVHVEEPRSEEVVDGEEALSEPEVINKGGDGSDDEG